MNAAPLRASVLLLAVSLVSCERNSVALEKAQWWRGESQRQDLAQRVEEAKARLMRRQDGANESAEVETQRRRVANELADLRAERDELQNALNTVKSQASEMHQAWQDHARSAAVGEKIASLTGSGGRTFQDVVITRVTDVGLEFRHANGAGRVAAADLTPQQQDLYGLEQNSSLAALDRESARSQAYTDKIDRALAAREDREDARQASADSASARRPGSAAAGLSGASHSRLSEPNRAVGSSYYPSYYRYWTGYNPSYYYAPTYIAPAPAANVYSASPAAIRALTQTPAGPVCPPASTAPSRPVIPPPPARPSAPPSPRPAQPVPSRSAANPYAKQQ